MEEPAALFLDQHVWVLLARARKVTGPNSDLEDLMVGAVEAGRLKLALNAINYMEIWNRGEDASRREVAAVMRDLSRYATVLALHSLQDLELHAALESWSAGLRPSSVALPRPAVIGLGVNFAFSSPTGRLRLVESVCADGVEGPSVEPSAELMALISRMPDADWEWFNLAGTDDLHGFSGMEVTPEFRLGDVYVEVQRETREIIASFRHLLPPKEATLRVLAGLQLNDWRVTLNEVWGAEGISRHLTRPEDAVALVRSIPTADVQMSLECAAHQNLSYVFKQHDRGDVHAISQTLPYFDAIYPDKHWGHIAVASGAAKRYRTTVLRSPEQLRAYLLGL